VVEEAGMNLLGDAFVWLNDPLNWQGPKGVPHLTYEHLYITFFAVLFGALVAMPPALALGHTGRGGGFTVAITNVSRAIPTLALLTIFAATAIGFGNRATIIALAVFSVPPLLTNTYVGVRQVDREAVDAARGMGYGELRVLGGVELPMSLPLIFGGLRTAAVSVVATATIAPLAGVESLGTPLVARGVYGSAGQIGAAIAVAVLAVLVEVVFAALQSAVTPRGLKVAGDRSHRRRGSFMTPTRRVQTP
jgi:osmoprotectant transport system permease protein